MKQAITNKNKTQAIVADRPSNFEMGLAALMHLSKIRIGAAITITAAFGYVLATGSLGFEMIIPLVGTLILATGASALNQYQEYEYDARMPRTSKRPIPSGELTPNSVLAFSILTIVAGLGILALSPLGGGWPFVLGLANVVAYNVIYTPLKRKSSMAVVPGSLVGAIPPMIGYTAGGGSVMAIDIVYIAAFLFVWQLPHFWMLLLKYHNEYRTAGFPVLTDKVSLQQMFLMIFVWTLAQIGMGVMMPFFGLGITLVGYAFILAISVWMIRKSVNIFRAGVEEADGKQWFLSLNIYTMLILLAVTMERVFLRI